MDISNPRSYGSTPSKYESSTCVVLVRLTKARETGFTDYLRARHVLSACPQEEPGHMSAVEGFEAARKTFSLHQREWEKHFAEHHGG